MVLKRERQFCMKNMERNECTAQKLKKKRIFGSKKSAIRKI